MKRQGQDFLPTDENLKTRLDPFLPTEISNSWSLFQKILSRFDKTSHRYLRHKPSNRLDWHFCTCPRQYSKEKTDQKSWNRQPEVLHTFENSSPFYSILLQSKSQTPFLQRPFPRDSGVFPIYKISFASCQSVRSELDH